MFGYTSRDFSRNSGAPPPFSRRLQPSLLPIFWKKRTLIVIMTGNGSYENTGLCCEPIIHVFLSEFRY